MEPAEIDWKNIDSQYERDEAYEHINAPKWLDLSAPDDASADDVAWFCRPDCRHPAIAEDFNRSTSSPKVKLVRSNSKLILSGEQKSDHRDAYLKRKGRIVTFFPSPIKPKLSYKKFSGDLENQNPNREATLPAMKLEKKAAIAKKEAIKSSAEKKRDDADEEVRGESQSKRTLPDQPKLRSTFSARNLFSGRDILSQISEFCHELKKFATGKESAATEEEEKRKNIEKVKEKASLRDDYMEEKKAVPVSTKKICSLRKRCELAVRLESNEEKSKILGEPRAFPPTPQRFPSPSGHGHLPSSKASGNSNSNSSPLGSLPKSKTPERRVLQELDQRRREEKRELIPKNEECSNSSFSSVAEGSAVDLFWFLKPCSYLVD